MEDDDGFFKLKMIMMIVFEEKFVFLNCLQFELFEKSA